MFIFPMLRVYIQVPLLYMLQLYITEGNYIQVLSRIRQETEVEIESLRADRMTLGECSLIRG